MVIFTFDVVNTQTISGVFSTTEQITVDWGDTSSDNYNGVDQAYSKDYGSAGNRTVTITATDESCLTKFTMTQSGANVQFALSDLPSGLTFFDCRGYNTVSGTLSDLPSGVEYFSCHGSNTVSGALSDLPSGLKYFYCHGSNTVSGTLSDLPSGVEVFSCYGSNTVSGTLSGLPSGVTYFLCHGYNTVSGTLSDLPSGLTNFSCHGSNTVSGALSDLPSGLKYFYCHGSNTVSGTLSDLPSGVEYFSCYGSNTVSGTLSGLPSGVTYFLCHGYNTVSGTLSDLPSGLTFFDCRGYNTVSGTLSDLPSGVEYFSCHGSNTVSGALSDLPSGVTYFSCGGSNTVSGYSGKTWTTKPATFILTPASGGLSTAEVDQLLIDFNDDLVWAAGNKITLDGTNAPRSATSNAAVTSLEGEGATVTTSAVLQVGNVYKITATEENHFGTGLEIGDYFVSVGTETVNANNKVKQVLSPSTDGVTLQVSKWDATENLGYANSAFKYNAASYFCTVRKVRG